MRKRRIMSNEKERGEGEATKRKRRRRRRRRKLLAVHWGGNSEFRTATK
jgi:hypothetical protein